ncbi:Alpha-N-acetylgalactosamine-specific lectin [Holothuria leucospilota]|uniref:Alpha-N-acetylgalactosamine-specific lectin n=1 Tax=Holothuria leucospilota TaxID=206669 RepID=A0A9Q1BLX6_HOLLE|nr:Alpha-N-acetylgalactosamine-specific lectin [Holothuria leucospilota]
MKTKFPVLLVALLSNHFTNGLEVVCPSEWTQWKGGCYRFFNQPRCSWKDAEEFCNKHQLSCDICPGETAHLVTIVSKEENDFLFNWWKSLRDPLPTDTRQTFWIDGNDEQSEGKFVLINGKPLEYSNWIRQQPNNWRNNQDCIAMTKSPIHDSDIGKWNDDKCSLESAFMCEFRCFQH